MNVCFKSGLFFSMLFFTLSTFLSAYVVPSSGGSSPDTTDCTTLTITNHSQHPLRIHGSECPGEILAEAAAYQEDTITIKATPNTKILLYINYVSYIVYSTTGSANQLKKVNEDKYPLRIEGILSNERYGSVTVYEGWEPK